MRKNREVADKIADNTPPPAIEVTKTASKSDIKSTSKASNK